MAASERDNGEAPQLQNEDMQAPLDSASSKQNNPLYDWTWGMLVKLNPFGQSAAEQDCPPHIPSNAPEPRPNIKSPTESSISDKTAAESFEGSLAESESEDEADIHQLIEESRTDSEEDEDSNTPALVEQPPSVETLTPRPLGKSKSKSTEILRLPSSRLASLMQPPERRRTIKFDDIAVLLDASAEGDIEEVRRLVESEKVDVNMCNEKGATALHRASGNGHTEVLELLLSHGALANVSDSDNWTPLHVASSAGSLEAVKMLLKHHANVEAVTDSGETPGDLTDIADIHRHLKQAHDAKYSSDHVTVLYDYQPPADAEDELPLAMGQVLSIKDRSDPDWWRAELADGRQGFIPRALVQ